MWSTSAAPTYYSILVCASSVRPVCLFVHHSLSKVSVEILSTAHLIVITWLRVCSLPTDFRQFSTLSSFLLRLRCVRLFTFIDVRARLTQPNEIQHTSNACKFIQDEKYTKELIRDPSYTLIHMLVMRSEVVMWCVVVVYSTAKTSEKRKKEEERNELEIHILFILNSEHDNKYFMIFLALCRGYWLFVVGISSAAFSAFSSDVHANKFSVVSFCCRVWRYDTVRNMYIV